MLGKGRHRVPGGGQSSLIPRPGSLMPLCDTQEDHVCRFGAYSKPRKAPTGKVRAGAGNTWIPVPGIVHLRKILPHVFVPGA